MDGDRQLEPTSRPAAVKLELPLLAEAAVAAERELRARALTDPDRCCGYFPALIGTKGIIGDLPACCAFAARLPSIRHGGRTYGFNFLRLSLVQQSGQAAYHLDSDAATALTGDVGAIDRRLISRLLLNLSTRSERTLQYLNVDPSSVELTVHDSYICAADPGALRRHGLTATIPRRHGATVHGVLFTANRVLHSGVDDQHGHFVAAYGIDTVARDQTSR